MSLKQFKRQKDVEATKDVVGGYSLLPTDVYKATIKMAYLGKSKNGANFVTLILNTPEQEHKETIYITNRNEEVYYTKQGVKHYLPGFVIIDELCLLVTGRSLSEMETEQKHVKVYNYDTNREEPTEVPVLVELLNAKLEVAITEEKFFKQEKGASGEYEDTDEEVSRNTITKFLSDDGFTINELIDEVEEPDYKPKWLARNQGQVYDRTKKKKKNAPSTGTPKAPKKAPKSLFKDEGNDDIDDDDLPF